MCPTWFSCGSDNSHCKQWHTESPEERRIETHSWPWNTSWDSSAIFHTLTERSLPPAVTQRSRLRLSSAVMASWCPKLQRVTIIVKVKYWRPMQVFFCGDINYIQISYSQSFHICVLFHVPHFYWAIMRGAVKIMTSLPEWKTLRRKRHLIWVTGGP